MANWRKKRLSNLILLSTVLFYILIYLLLIVMTRTGIQWSLKNGTTGSAPVTDDAGEVLYPYTDFQAIELEGRWDVSVISGSEYTVLVDMGAAKPKGTRVAKNGTTLVMKNPDKERTLTAMIIMPTLGRVTARGDAAVSLDGFATADFSVDLSDNSRLGGANCRFGNLEIRAVKSAAADLQSVPVGSARVSLSGNTSTALLLEGGPLTGHVTGQASLDLYGTIGDDKLKTGDKARVTRN
jgi:hypothetical protein